jgi:hypothetical protein
VKILGRVLSIVIVSFLVSCASTETKVYSIAGAKDIASWTVDFQYQPGEVEVTSKSSGETETKATAGGRGGLDLTLRDEILYALQDDHGLKVSTSHKEGMGKILIHPLHFTFGGIHSVRVLIQDSSGNTLARIKIENGDRNATFKKVDDFAEYAADSIAEVLK